MKIDAKSPKARGHVFDMVYASLAKQGVDPMEAIDCLARYWFSECVILEEDDNRDQLVYLKYVRKLSGIPVTELVQQAVQDWLDISYPSMVRRLEEKLGLPTTLISQPDETATV